MMLKKEKIVRSVAFMDVRVWPIVSRCGKVKTPRSVWTVRRGLETLSARGQSPVVEQSSFPYYCGQNAHPPILI